MKIWLLSILLTFGIARHDFHVSLSNVEYSSIDSTYQVSIKIFTDDFDLAIQKSYDLDIDQKGSERKIQEYILSKFKILDADEKVIPLTYIGKELEMDVTWVYLESGIIDRQENIFIQNVILNEVFDDQSHIVHFKTGESFQTELLNNSKQRAQF